MLPPNCCTARASSVAVSMSFLARSTSRGDRQAQLISQRDIGGDETLAISDGFVFQVPCDKKSFTSDNDRIQPSGRLDQPGRKLALQIVDPSFECAHCAPRLACLGLQQDAVFGRCAACHKLIRQSRLALNLLQRQQCGDGQIEAINRAAALLRARSQAQGGAKLKNLALQIGEVPAPGSPEIAISRKRIVQEFALCESPRCTRSIAVSLSRERVSRNFDTLDESPSSALGSMVAVRSRSTRRSTFFKSLGRQRP